MTFGLIFLTGALLSAGLVLIVAGARRPAPHLGDTIALLQQPIGMPTTHGPGFGAQPSAPSRGSRTERIGGWLYSRSPVPLTVGQRRALQIKGRSVAAFYADKAVWMIIGLTLPPLLAGCYAMITETIPVAMPVLLGLIGGVAGFFVPDLLLRGQAKESRNDAAAALLMYIDLVTLERLANASGTQALTNAARLSDVALFRQLRGALERARLEQQSPYPELRRLAEQLGLGELTDLADVMQLDESGAALSGSLRARVRELRDAHLATNLRTANEASEQMTIYMTIPALVFGVIFIVPVLLRIVAA